MEFKATVRSINEFDLLVNGCSVFRVGTSDSVVLDQAQSCLEAIQKSRVLCILGRGATILSEGLADFGDDDDRVHNIPGGPSKCQNHHEQLLFE